MKKDFFNDVMRIVQKGVERYGGRTALAKAAGTSPANVTHWLSGKRNPGLAEISAIMNIMGVSPSLPSDEPARDVCFVSAKIVPAGEQAAPPVAEDYIAAPLVGEVGAGPGYVPETEIRSWFLAYKNLPAVRYRRNLLAVEIGKNSTSMLPTLRPGDIVLVDRDDRRADTPGHIMLVLDPDGAGMVKRVAVEDRGNGDSRITFYSDNAVENPPLVYSWRKDYDSNWEKVIVGRCVWAWSDITGK